MPSAALLFIHHATRAGECCASFFCFRAGVLPLPVFVDLRPVLALITAVSSPPPPRKSPTTICDRRFSPHLRPKSAWSSAGRWRRPKNWGARVVEKGWEKEGGGRHHWGRKGENVWGDRWGGRSRRWELGVDVRPKA